MADVKAIPRARPSLPLVEGVRRSFRGKNPRRSKEECKNPQESSAAAAEQVTDALKKTAGNWTERPEAFKLLVECAALLRISEKIDPEAETLPPENLARKAIGEGAVP